MGSFNEKNGTHLSSNSEEHVLKAQNAALNDYIASISKSEAKPVEIKPEKGAAQSGEQKTGYVPSAKEIQALLGIFDAPAAEAHRDDVKLQNVPNKKAAGTAAGLVVNK